MRLTTATLVAIAFGSAAGGFVPGGTNVHLALDLNGVALAQDDESADRAIERAFRAVLDREPSSTERRRYRLLMRENEWGEVDVRRDLSERPDYRRFSKERGVEPEAVIRKAYQDILGRDPDSEGVRTYRSKMIDEGWSEREVREALRRSEEHASSEHRYASADRIIRRAYQDILGREPDPEGQQTFRRHIVEDGFDQGSTRSLERAADRGRPPPERRVPKKAALEKGDDRSARPAGDPQAVDRWLVVGASAPTQVLVAGGRDSGTLGPLLATLSAGFLEEAFERAAALPKAAHPRAASLRGAGPLNLLHRN